jgi:glycosyltransferase involved in cell wall biosynthesis
VKILIAPTEIANQVYLNAKGLKELNDEIVVKTISHNHSFYDNSRYDYVYNNKNFITGLFGRLSIFLRTLFKSDVYIYHYGSSLSHYIFLHFDVFINKIFGKKIIVYFHGSDVRNPKITKSKNPWYTNPYNESVLRSKFNCIIWSYFTNGNAIFSDPTLEKTLEKYFKKLHFLNLSIDVGLLNPFYPERSNRIKIGHIPSNIEFKGTKYIRNSIQELKSKYLMEFEYLECTNIPHQEAMNLLEDADLVIDQMMIGGHGVFTLEAMALGKPVICNIWESDYARHYDPSFPIIPANPDNLTNVLFEWISCDLEVRKNKGKESRKYVEKFHNYNSGSNSLFKIIEKL